MASKKVSFQVRPEEAGARLDQLLAQRLPELLGQPVSKAKARKLIVAGAVYLNGRRVRIASKPLLSRAKVDAFVDLEKLFDDSAAQDSPFDMSAERILYEDEWLIAVDKPPGLPTQPTVDEARLNLYAAVKKFLARRDKVAQPYLGLHHRLDRDTSGVILFTKKTEANAGVARIFAEHEAQKVYQALTARPFTPPATWHVKNYLGRERRQDVGATKYKAKQARFTSVKGGGDFAETDFRLIESLARGLHIEALPRTGRTHQIRVHLAEYGLPILGDSLYGDRGSAARCMLHAASLTFPHPIHQNQTSIRSPLPGDFDQCLTQLR